MFETLGSGAVGAILAVAGQLKEEHVPGLVALVFFAIFVGCAVFYGIRSSGRRKALNAAAAIVAKAEGEAAFRAQLPSINQEMAGLKGRYGGAGDAIVEAWDEFHETVLTPEKGDEALRNGLRPALFFNAEDLGMSPGFWRIMPSLFVSAGLICTFLGLIVLLHDFSEAMKNAPLERKAVVLQDQMPEFIGLAGAKFIMSLSGLACSMALTILLRRGGDRVERAIHGLCRSIEQRVTFLSLESLASDQLSVIREQTEQMKKLNTELIEGLARPLRDELPQAISTAIATEMRPLMNSMSQTASSGLGDMVGDLSSRFSRDVGDALSRASRQLNEAADRLATLAGAMENGGARMDGAMQGAVAKLAEAAERLGGDMERNAAAATGAFTAGANEFLSSMNATLAKIERSTAQSNQKLEQVAQTLTEAATNFGAEVDRAGAAARVEAERSMGAASQEAAASVRGAGAATLQAMEEALKSTGDAAAETAAKASADLLRPLEEMCARLEAAAGAMLGGAEAAHRFGERAKEGAASMERAAGGARDSASAFQSAADPLRRTAEATQAAADKTALAAQEAANAVQVSARDVAQSAERALDAAASIAKSNAEASQKSLEAILASLARFEALAKNFDQIDEKLGRAFEEFRTQVESAVGTITQTSDEVHAKYSSALTTLHEVVDQAQIFSPSSRRA